MSRIAVAVAVLLLSVAIGGVVSARAGTYQVLACSQITSDVNNSWEAFNSDPTHLSTGQVCPPIPGSGEPPKSTGMFATDTLDSSGGTPDGAIAGWRFTAPPGTAVVGFQDDRFLGAYGDNGWSPFVKADSTILETCTFTLVEERCSLGNPFGSESLNGMLPVSEASTLTVGIKCAVVGGCTTGATLHRAWAALYGAKVILSSQAPPSIGSPTGSLWEPGAAGGFHKGTEQVHIAASDLTGVARVTISVDEHVSASQEGVCDYSKPLPCQALTATFQVDTTQLADGAHALALEAYDAAGNEGRVTERIVIANHPPPPPVSPKVVVQPDDSFVVSWSDPIDAAPIVGASYQLCPPSAGSCSIPILAGHDSPLSFPASAGGQTVKIWLTDAAGNSNPANAVSLVLSGAGKGVIVQPGGTQQLPTLRLRHSLHGHRLTMIALTPAGVPGPIQFSVQALRGRTRVGHVSRKAKVKHGQAKVVFILSRSEFNASHLSITVSAQGASAVRLSLALHRRTPHRALSR